MQKLNEPLAKYTSWKIGGNAKRYYRPKDLYDLCSFIKSLPDDEEILFLGLGSNVLIRDGGFQGTVIHLFKVLQDIVIQDIKEQDIEVQNIKIQDAENKPLAPQNNLPVTIKVSAGVTCAKIAKFCAKHNLHGAEFFAGIPGTMGGALAMNAGAFGSEVWEYVKKVEMVNNKGEIITRSKTEFEISYRTVVRKLKNKAENQAGSKLANKIDTTSVDSITREWFIAGFLQFPKLSASTQTQTNKIKELLKTRNNAQPIGLLTCGSVFRNPERNYAAKLIEASKLKGRRVGNASISTKHANFIINLGNATATDVEELINQIRTKVLQDHKVELQLEVRIIGKRLEL